MEYSDVSSMAGFAVGGLGAMYADLIAGTLSISTELV